MPVVLRIDHVTLVVILTVKNCYMSLVATVGLLAYAALHHQVIGVDLVTRQK